MGYESSVHIQGTDAVQLINYMMGELEDENPDIIFVGSQSQTVPATDGALKYYPIPQYEFLLGTAPDCYILCVNVFDDNSYIQRTIGFLESVFEAKVLALALFPFNQANKWLILGTKKVMTPLEVIKVIDALTEEKPLETSIFWVGLMFLTMFILGGLDILIDGVVSCKKEKLIQQHYQNFSDKCMTMDLQDLETPKISDKKAQAQKVITWNSKNIDGIKNAFGGILSFSLQIVGFAYLIIRLNFLIFFLYL